jgi:dTDP-4-dehydrorhamnose 3,5-epimerase-like enzyme
MNPVEAGAPGIVIEALKNRGDARGDAFDLPPHLLERLGRLAETHLVTMLPGAVRGNHLHPETSEVLTVFHRDAWTFAWRDRRDTATQRREFTGAGAVAIFLAPGIAHALRNSGTAEMVLTSLSNWSGVHGHAPFERVTLIGP